MNNNATVFVLGEGEEEEEEEEEEERERKGVKRAGSVSVPGQLPTYPSPNPTTVYW